MRKGFLQLEFEDGRIAWMDEEQFLSIEPREQADKGNNAFGRWLTEEPISVQEFLEKTEYKKGIHRTHQNHGYSTWLIAFVLKYIGKDAKVIIPLGFDPLIFQTTDWQACIAPNLDDNKHVELKE